MSTSLQRVLDEFVHRYRTDLADPAYAHDRCVEISEEFAALLAEHGVDDAEVVSGAKVGEVPEFPGATLFLGGHYAVRVGGEVYDWTARQFDPDAAVPTVRTLAAWRSEWPDLKAGEVAR